MNWGVSTMPCGVSRRPRRARMPVPGATVASIVKRSGRGSGRGGIDGGPAADSAAADAPALPAPAGSAIAGSQSGPRVVSGSRDVRPEARHVGLAAARRRDLEAKAGQVLAGKIRRDPALRRPVDEAEPEQERLVDVLDRLDLLAQDGTERSDPHRPRAELLDDRGQELPIGGIEAFVIDLEEAERFVRGGLGDPAVAVDLGVVAGSFQEPVDDAGCAPPAAGDGDRGAGIDVDVEDPGRALDDLGELGVRVEVEPVRGPEAVAQRRGDASGPRRRADDREGLEGEPERPRRRPLADHDVEGVVLHRRVEDLLDRVVEAMDLVDEKDVALVEAREHRGEVAGPLDRRAGRVADVDPELAGDDRGERRLAEAGRAVQEDVVGRLFPRPGRLEQDAEVGLDLALADVLVERARPERALDGGLDRIRSVGRQQAEGVVRHVADCSIGRLISYKCSNGPDARRQSASRTSMVIGKWSEKPAGLTGLPIPPNGMGLGESPALAMPDKPTIS